MNGKVYLMKATIEWDGQTIVFEGEPESIIQQFESFLSKEIPTLSLANKLLVSVDLQDLSKIIDGIVNITSDNKIIFNFDLKSVPTADRILIILITRKFLYLSDTGASENVGAKELASLIFSSPKSTSSRLSELSTEGLVEKVGNKGQYKVSIQGILHFKKKKLSKILNKLN